MNQKCNGDIAYSWRLSFSTANLEHDSFRNKSEWDKLAKWVVNNKIFSHNVRWLIQTPRLYNVYKNSKTVENFEDVIRSMLWAIDICFFSLNWFVLLEYPMTRSCFNHIFIQWPSYRHLRTIIWSDERPKQASWAPHIPTTSCRFWQCRRWV